MSRLGVMGAFGLAAVWAVATLGLGALVSDIGPWYRTLRKPSWQPPDWLFAPAWTLIFTLAAIAAVLAARSPTASIGVRTAIVASYAVNGVLNTLWSVLFFAVRRPDWALIEVVALWLSIVAMLLAVRAGSRPAAWFLVPYLAWVSFAAVLNYRITRLNP